jgi:uncharacterized protein (DUF1778 family)
MATRTERIEARIDPDRASRIRRAAELANASVSSFVVEAAVERAERILVEHHSTTVPSQFFDRLLAALDEPPISVPSIEKAAERRREVVKPR